MSQSLMFLPDYCIYHGQNKSMISESFLYRFIVPEQPLMPYTRPTNNTSEAAVHVTWSHLACVNQNSEITGYKLRLQIEQYSWNSHGDDPSPFFLNISYPHLTPLLTALELDYVVRDLSPTIEYGISVAGVNINGDVGPFSVSVVVRTLHPRGD